MSVFGKAKHDQRTPRRRNRPRHSPKSVLVFLSHSPGFLPDSVFCGRHSMACCQLPAPKTIHKGEILWAGNSLHRVFRHECLHVTVRHLPFSHRHVKRSISGRGASSGPISESWTIAYRRSSALPYILTTRRRSFSVFSAGVGLKKRRIAFQILM